MVRNGENLLNEDIRLSTSRLKDMAPLPGRSLVVGGVHGFSCRLCQTPRNNAPKRGA
jgi:hypothetical protein